MKIIFSSRGWEDYLHRQRTHEKAFGRVNELIKETCRTAFSGIGKPEPLRHIPAGYWSRRITDEHRIVSKVEREAFLIAQGRYHY